MKNINELKEGDYIAFKWAYGLNLDGKGDIIVDNITALSRGEVLVHFVYGLKGESEWVKKEDILAIGNMEGKDRIKGWSGRYDILKPNHPLMLQEIKTN